jgi:hypothetical protein
MEDGKLLLIRKIEVMPIRSLKISENVAEEWELI